MKNIITLLIVFGMSLNVIAQTKEKVTNKPNFDERTVHFGFYLGGNRNSFHYIYNAVDTKKYDPKETPEFVNEHPNITVKANYGFNLGLIGDVRIHDNINVRFEPGLISNSKRIVFNHLKERNERVAGNTYLHLPVIFKFSVDRYKNIRPYLLLGGSYDYNFSSNQSNANDNFTNEFRQKSNVFMYELGFGMDFYLPYFKFSPSIRSLYAINSELHKDNKPSPWTDPIDYMGTRGFYINLAFE